MSWFTDIFKSKEQKKLEAKAVLTGASYAIAAPDVYRGMVEQGVEQYFSTNNPTQQARIGGNVIGYMAADRHFSILSIVGYPPSLGTTPAEVSKWIAYQQRYDATVKAFDKGVCSAGNPDQTSHRFISNCDVLRIPKMYDSYAYQDAHDDAYNRRLAELGVPPQYHAPRSQAYQQPSPHPHYQQAQASFPRQHGHGYAQGGRYGQAGAPPISPNWRPR